MRGEAPIPLPLRQAKETSTKPVKEIPKKRVVKLPSGPLLAWPPPASEDNVKPKDAAPTTLVKETPPAPQAQVQGRD